MSKRIIDPDGDLIRVHDASDGRMYVTVEEDGTESTVLLSVSQVHELIRILTAALSAESKTP